MADVSLLGPEPPTAPRGGPGSVLAPGAGGVCLVEPPVFPCVALQGSRSWGELLARFWALTGRAQACGRHEHRPSRRGHARCELSCELSCGPGPESHPSLDMCAQPPQGSACHSLLCGHVSSSEAWHSAGCKTQGSMVGGQGAGLLCASASLLQSENGQGTYSLG